MIKAGFLNKRQRLAFSCAAFLLLTTFVPPPYQGHAADTVEGRLDAHPVPLNEDDPRQRRLGPLLFLRGWDLTSSASRFGGISAIHVENRRVTALSDSGDLIAFDLPARAGTSRVRIAPLPRPTIPGLSRFNPDTEALAMSGAHAWIAFERLDLIGRYRRPDWQWEAWSKPARMQRWQPNSGAEAMVRLGDRRFLVFAEGSPMDEFSDILLFAGDPAEPNTEVVGLRHRRSGDYRITDAALMPDGRLLILERRFSWLGSISARLSVASLGGAVPGTVIEMRPVAELSPPLTVDNMEALSVTREGGRTIVRIASDNNYLGVQRNLLLEFQWLEPPR